MNKIKLLSTLLVLAFFVCSAPVYSAPLAAPVISAPDTLSQIGIVAAVKGSVTIDNKKQAGRVVQGGEPVYIGDTVSTDSKGTLQILLLDETIFTIGPNSAIVIDKFIYDPSSQSGEVNAKVVKGVFRFVTGKIARKRPSDMKVDLPSGSIGVRGTIVAGQTDGKRSTVILLGPGSKTNTNHRIGQITVGNEASGKFEEVTVTRPGFGSVIEGEGVAPATPFKVPQSEIDQIMDALEPQAPAESKDGAPEGSQGANPTEQAGQDRAGASEPVKSLGRSSESLKELESESQKLAQDATEEIIPDGVARFQQLSRLSGSYKYRGENIPLSGTGNETFDFSFDVNFDNRTLGGSNISENGITSTAGGGVSYAIGQKSFGDSGDAVFQYDNVGKTLQAGQLCTGCQPANFTIGLNNSGGTIADNARVSLFFNDGVNSREGSGESDSR